MTPTRIDLPPAVRAAMTELLQLRLLDLRNLYLAAKTLHWNVRGAQFLPLHKLFDKVAEVAAELLDEVAEMSRSMGGEVNATTGSLVEVSPDDANPLALVIFQVASVLALTRQAAGMAMELDDLVSSDMLTRGSGRLQKLLYLLESSQPV